MKNKKNYQFEVIFTWYPAGKLTKTNNPRVDKQLTPEHLAKYVEVYKHMLMKFKHKLSYLFSLMKKREEYIEQKKREDAERLKKMNAKKRYARKKKN